MSAAILGYTVLFGILRLKLALLYLLLFLALNILIVESVLAGNVSTLRVNVRLRSRTLMKTINLSYSIWLMQATVCGSSIANHSCLRI